MRNVRVLRVLQLTAQLVAHAPQHLVQMLLLVLEQLSLAHHVLGLLQRHQRVAALPLDVVLRLLLQQPDALQHIGDVVDAALLHVQRAAGGVQVDAAVRRPGQQVDELLGEQAE